MTCPCLRTLRTESFCIVILCILNYNDNAARLLGLPVL